MATNRYYGDKAYVDAQRQADAEAEGVEWRVLRKAKRGRKLTCADRSFNRKSTRTRARVELHPQAPVGLSQGALSRLGQKRRPTIHLLANVYLARRELMAT